MARPLDFRSSNRSSILLRPTKFVRVAKLVNARGAPVRNSCRSLNYSCRFKSCLSHQKMLDIFIKLIYYHNIDD